jgi:hypothetical protein
MPVANGVVGGDAFGVSRRYSPSIVQSRQSASGQIRSFVRIGRISRWVDSSSTLADRGQLTRGKALSILRPIELTVPAGHRSRACLPAIAEQDISRPGQIASAPGAREKELGTEGNVPDRRLASWTRIARGIADLRLKVREGREKTLHESKGRFFPHLLDKSLILQKSRTLSSESILFNGLRGILREENFSRPFAARPLWDRSRYSHNAEA